MSSPITRGPRRSSKNGPRRSPMATGKRAPNESLPRVGRGVASSQLHGLPAVHEQFHPCERAIRPGKPADRSMQGFAGHVRPLPAQLLSGCRADPKWANGRPFKMQFPANGCSGEWSTFSCKSPFPWPANACTTSSSCPARAQADMDEVRCGRRGLSEALLWCGAVPSGDGCGLSAGYARDRIFRTIIGANAKALSVLNTVEDK